MQHLADSGCKAVGFISGPSDWPASQDRLRAYKQAVKDFALRDDPDLIEVVIGLPRAAIRLAKASFESCGV